jgi:hypothetical protein
MQTRTPLPHRTGKPTQIIVTQALSTDAPDVRMEIQEGQGPYARLVTRPLQLGDTISLVVKSDDVHMTPDGMDMFVHTCYASDGGERRVLLIDDSGYSLYTPRTHTHVCPTDARRAHKSPDS